MKLELHHTDKGIVVYRNGKKEGMCMRFFICMDVSDPTAKHEAEVAEVTA